jgi:hypothetical protein
MGGFSRSLRLKLGTVCWYLSQYKLFPRDSQCSVLFVLMERQWEWLQEKNKGRCEGTMEAVRAVWIIASSYSVWDANTWEVRVRLVRFNIIHPFVIVFVSVDPEINTIFIQQFLKPWMPYSKWSSDEMTARVHSTVFHGVIAKSHASPHSCRRIITVYCNEELHEYEEYDVRLPKSQEQYKPRWAVTMIHGARVRLALACSKSCTNQLYWDSIKWGKSKYISDDRVTKCTNPTFQLKYLMNEYVRSSVLWSIGIAIK